MTSQWVLPVLFFLCKLGTNTDMTELIRPADECKATNYANFYREKKHFSIVYALSTGRLCLKKCSIDNWAWHESGTFWCMANFYRNEQILLSNWMHTEKSLLLFDSVLLVFESEIWNKYDFFSHAFFRNFHWIWITSFPKGKHPFLFQPINVFYSILRTLTCQKHLITF